MSEQFKSYIMTLLAFALFFGFLHLFTPPRWEVDFARLHIFLFNLCAGGTLILYFTRERGEVEPVTGIFSFLSILYAICAFLEMYLPAVILSFVLSLIVEYCRIRRFSLFPFGFFKKTEPVAEKFHQASLLCLSIGLAISGLVIINEEYLHLVSMKKLTLNTFFLGFSFPISLITMSVMFSMMHEEVKGFVRVLKNLGFWNVNLGVIIFFIFILFEMLTFQLVVTIILLLTVILIFSLFMQFGIRIQQKSFLVSGMVFLLVTAVTGIAYIVLEFFPVYYNSEVSRLMLKLHSFSSLYGWNLSGLVVIMRFSDFPLYLHSKYVILMHWIIVMLFAPLGYYYAPFAICAVFCYTVFLYVVLTTRKKAPPIIAGK